MYIYIYASHRSTDTNFFFANNIFIVIALTADNKSKMPSLEMTQIAWWDEVHMKQKLGFMNLARTSTSVRFYRNSDGTVATKAEDGNEQGGQLANASEVLHVKFPGEMRGSFGCALVEKVLPNGTKVEVPLRAAPFFLYRTGHRNNKKIREIDK